MEILKAANLGLAFLLELAMLAAYGYWASRLPIGTTNKILIGVALLAVIAVLWGLFAAPNASYHLSQPWLFGFQTIVFGIAGYLLYLSGQAFAAGLFLSVWLVSTLLSFYWRQ